MTGQMLAVAVLGLVVSASAWGQEPEKESEKVEFSKAYGDCLDKSDGITLRMRECNGEELRRQDGQLNSLYRELSAKSTPEARAALVRTQRAWIAFRDAECEYEGEQHSGGTLEAIVIGGCHVEMTAQRVMQLRRYVRIEHGFREEP